jgi:hypothetical protein
MVLVHDAERAAENTYGPYLVLAVTYVVGVLLRLRPCPLWYA